MFQGFALQKNVLFAKTLGIRKGHQHRENVKCLSFLTDAL